MKKFYLIITFLLISIAVQAQAPEKMSFQAVIRNQSNSLVTNQSVGMRISILKGSINGPAAYIETQNPSSNQNGLITLEIGTGTASQGSFSSIDWADGPYYIKTETDPSGGSSYSITGTSQFLSTPYALYAKTSGSSLPGPAGPQGTKGDTGLTGATGLQGTKGDTGLTGAAGPQGTKGDTGLTGAAGSQGTKGDTGLTGAAGPQGTKGDTGLTGSAGPQGTKGDTGLTGAAGPQGTKGDTGLTGAAGPQGTKGDTGLTGSAGPQGTKGDTGLTGAAGPQGSSSASIVFDDAITNASINQSSAYDSTGASQIYSKSLTSSGVYLVTIYLKANKSTSVNCYLKFKNNFISNGTGYYSTSDSTIINMTAVLNGANGDVLTLSANQTDLSAVTVTGRIQLTKL